MIPSHDAEARLVTLLHAYLAADYRWEQGGHWHEFTLGEPAQMLETEYPDAHGFGLVTAWNPHSVERPEPINRRADDELRALLDAGGWPHRPAFARARNRTWREPGWLVAGIALPEFDALARRFGQLSTLYAVRGGPVRLRMYAHPPASSGTHPWVDWVGV